MGFFESIFTCHNAKNTDKNDDDIRDIKAEVRDIKVELKNIWREIDMRVEMCDNKSVALQSSIDLKFDLMNTKIDNLIILIQNKN